MISHINQIAIHLQRKHIKYVWDVQVLHLCAVWLYINDTASNTTTYGHYKYIFKSLPIYVSAYAFSISLWATFEHIVDLHSLNPIRRLSEFSWLSSQKVKASRGCIDSRVSQGLSHTRLHSSTDNGISAVNHCYFNQYFLPFQVRPHVFTSAGDLRLPTVMWAGVWWKQTSDGTFDFGFQESSHFQDRVCFEMAESDAVWFTL